jgi:hypothetical protein
VHRISQSLPDAQSGLGFNTPDPQLPRRVFGGPVATMVPMAAPPTHQSRHRHAAAKSRSSATHISDVLYFMETWFIIVRSFSSPISTASTPSQMQCKANMCTS